MRGLASEFSQPQRWIAAVLCAVVAWMATLPATAASLQETESLQAAIEHLTGAFPDEYSGGVAFLQRLETLKRQAENANPSELADLQARLENLRREALAANPLLTRQPIAFVVREQYRPDHHNTGTMFQRGEINAESFRSGGAVKTIDFARGGRVDTLLTLPEGVARDLEVRFDGRKVLLSIRRNAADSYSIYELNTDGSGLRQLTFDNDVSDIDPCYLPDGRIVFASTRDPKYCGCNRHIQANLFVMQADGANIRQIGRNNLFESRPSLLADGRILYDRWEYVDRHFGPSFGLWTVNPDGTNHALYYGNNAWSPGAIFDAREIPGSQRFVAVFSSCHDRPWGAIVLLDRRQGLDGTTPIVFSWPVDISKRLDNPSEVERRRGFEHPNAGWIDSFRSMPVKYEDPYPLNDRFFLCSRMTGIVEQMGIYLIDTFGNEILLHAEAPGCFDPMPLAARSRPPVIPSRIDLTQDSGTFYVKDVYQGTGMEGVPRGTIKWIRVVEAPPKRFWTSSLWHIDTHQAPAMNYNCTNNKRILGDAPVEADGSAYFEVPAGRFVFFQALDADGMMVQSMRSGTTLQPGERSGCVGCHEYRLSSMPSLAESSPLALKRPASKLRPWYGPAREFNYLTEVQPAFDKHCVTCHDYGKEAGKAINLAGDLGLVFNTSYLELRNKSPMRWHPDSPGEERSLVKAVDDGPPQVLPPYAWGSHRSRLIDFLRPEHYDVKLSPEELDRVVTWIDMNAPYYGTYATAYPDNPFARSPLDQQQLTGLAELTGVSLNAQYIGAELNGSQVNFTRPELSPCLQGLQNAKPTEYHEALDLIQAGQELLAKRPRADMPGFQPVSPMCQHQLQRLQHRQQAEMKSCDAIVRGERHYDRLSKVIMPLAVLSSAGLPYPAGNDNKKYAAHAAIDGDPETFCCLLDDSLTGQDDYTMPPKAAAPVTGFIVFDLGAKVEVTGLTLLARADGGPFNPKRVDVFALPNDYAQNTPSLESPRDSKTVRPLLKDYAVRPLQSGEEATLSWSPVEARYLGLQVHDSYEAGGGGKHFNFQLAEVTFRVELDPQAVPPGLRAAVSYEKKDTLQQTLLALRQQLIGQPIPSSDTPSLVTVNANDAAAFWNRIQRDFPTKQNRLLEYVHHEWFAPTGWLARTDTQLEQTLIRRAIEETGATGSHLLDELNRLIEQKIPADDPRWLDLCAKTAEFAIAMREVVNLRTAINHLTNQFPQRYPGTKYREALEALQRRLIEQSANPWKVSSNATKQLVDELVKLRHAALARDNPLLSPGKILFVKRYTYRTGWYYAEFMQANRVGGNLCVLSLDDGTVTELCPQLASGIIDRYDLSFDAQRVVFGYRPAADKAFRLYEVGIDGQGLRQLTFDPPDEAERLASYGLTPGKNELGPWRAHTDDFHPCYLPDGGICFASSRCERGVLCDQPDNLSVNVLYHIDSDGRNMQMLSEGALSESTPSVMNDGRILYTRWEYVDKGVIAVQSLWAMRPDGTGSTEIFGNHHEFPPVLIHGRAIPGCNNLFVATCTMHHPFAVGPILLIDNSKNIRTLAPLTNITPDTDVWVDGVGSFPRGEAFSHRRNDCWINDNIGPLFCEPYPLSENFFLVSCNPDKPHNDQAAYGLWLIDTFGNRVLLYDDPEISCWQPMLLRPREMPPVIASTREPAILSSNGDSNDNAECKSTVAACETSNYETSSNEAQIVLTDIYEGLDDIPRGEIKYLRIFEQVARPWTAHRFWPDDHTLGQNAVISLNAHIYVKVLHGVVPVESDGSAHFTVPADKNLFFQALDKDYMEVQRMRTFVNLQPGEVRSCIGCHEQRNQAPPRRMPLALQRPPVRPTPQPGETTVPRPLYYPTDVQPILDQHCVACHNADKPDGDLILTGELTTYFNRSYENLMRKKLLTCIQEFVGPQPRAQKTNVTPLPPKALGSHASKLITVLHQGHYDVNLSQAEWLRLITWVDANGPYYGSYFGRRHLKYRDLPDFRPTPTLQSASGLAP